MLQSVLSFGADVVQAAGDQQMRLFQVAVLPFSVCWEQAVG